MQSVDDQHGTIRVYAKPNRAEPAGPNIWVAETDLGYTPEGRPVRRRRHGATADEARERLLASLTGATYRIAGQRFPDSFVAELDRLRGAGEHDIVTATIRAAARVGWTTSAIARALNVSYPAAQNRLGRTFGSARPIAVPPAPQVVTRQPNRGRLDAEAIAELRRLAVASRRDMDRPDNRDPLVAADRRAAAVALDQLIAKLSAVDNVSLRAIDRALGYADGACRQRLSRRRRRTPGPGGEQVPGQSYPP